MASQKELMRQAMQYQEMMRRRLEAIAQPGIGQGQWGLFGQGGEYESGIGGLNAGPNAGRDNSASTRLQAGQAVTDAMVKSAIAKSGGNPYLAKLRELKTPTTSSRPLGRTGRGVTAAAKEAEQNLMQQLAAQYQSARDEANAANEYRFGYGVQNLEGLRDRNMGRVENFGKAAKADLEERFATNLADVTANLSSRGLGNSTTVSAFEAKNARDLAREQQRLSEMVDDRAARYDESLTNNAVGFVERRNDVAPDYGQLAQLAQAYGASGAVAGGGGQAMGNGAVAWRGEQPVPVPQQQVAPQRTGWNLPYAVSPWVAAGIQNNVSGAYQGIGNLVATPQATGSNAYPTTPGQRRRDALSQMSEEEVAAYGLDQLANQMEANANRTQRINARMPVYNQSPYSQHRQERLAMQNAGMYGQPVQPIQNIGRISPTALNTPIVSNDPEWSIENARQMRSPLSTYYQQSFNALNRRNLGYGVPNPGDGYFMQRNDY